MKDWGAVGLAISVVKDGRVVFEKGYGVRELGKPDAVDTATLFAIGSTTKAMTAASIGMHQSRADGSSVAMGPPRGLAPRGTREMGPPDRESGVQLPESGFFAPVCGVTHSGDSGNAG